MYVMWLKEGRNGKKSLVRRITVSELRNDRRRRDMRMMRKDGNVGEAVPIRHHHNLGYLN